LLALIFVPAIYRILMSRRAIAPVTEVPKMAEGLAVLGR
jgi:hypothetical protein